MHSVRCRPTLTMHQLVALRRLRCVVKETAHTQKHFCDAVESIAKLFLCIITTTRSQAVAMIADRTASQQTR